MKTVTIYESEDGARFNTTAECLRYEGMLEMLKAVSMWMPKRDDDRPGFSGGEGYIQHVETSLAAFDHDFAEIIEMYFSKETADRYRQQPTGFVWRILSDSSDPFSKAICHNPGHRRICIDSQLREWGQPCFAMNPACEKKEVRLN